MMMPKRDYERAALLGFVAGSVISGLCLVALHYLHWTLVVLMTYVFYAAIAPWLVRNLRKVPTDWRLIDYEQETKLLFAYCCGLVAGFAPVVINALL